MARTPARPLTLLEEAEQARQVVNVLSRLETRIASGRWVRGYRVGPDGGNCLIGAIDEATRWVLPGVADQVTRELAARLPAPLRALGRVRPRLALATYNDTVGGRAGALELVRRTRYALGGLPLITFAGESQPTPWVADRQAPHLRPPAGAASASLPPSAPPADGPPPPPPGAIASPPASPSATAPMPASATGDAAPERIIDLTDRWVARQPLRR